MINYPYNYASCDALFFHRGQVRKGTEVPYFTHLLSVSSLVFEYGGDTDTAIAALFHDALEDVGPKVEETIRGLYGEKVWHIVQECSDCEKPADGIKPPWRERKEKHIAELKDKSQEALLVICADKLHNTRSLTDKYIINGKVDWSQFKGGKDGMLWYLEEMCNGLMTTLDNPMKYAFSNEISNLKMEIDFYEN